MNTFDKQKYIFSSIFLLANKLQAMGDFYLNEEGITTKQWFLILIVSQFGKKPPMLTEVANVMGSSRQNVKQLALKLQEKGFLILEKDKSDNRTIRLKLTDKNQDFWDKRQEKDSAFIKNLFNSLTVEDVNAIYSGFSKLLDDINNMNLNS